jgi:Mg/Co/Ni transporter MgtE
MITDRDIAIRAVAAGQDPTTKVRDVMSAEVKYCFDDEDVSHVSQNMAELQVRRLPVVDREKRLVGIISFGDIAGEQDPDKSGMALRGISQPEARTRRRRADHRALRSRGISASARG